MYQSKRHYHITPLIYMNLNEEGQLGVRNALTGRPILVPPQHIDAFVNALTGLRAGMVTGAARETDICEPCELLAMNAPADAALRKRYLDKRDILVAYCDFCGITENDATLIFIETSERQRIIATCRIGEGCRI